MLLPHFAIILQIGKFQLTQSLKYSDGYGIAQVQAADILPHGDPYAAFPVGFQKIFRQTLGFFSKEKVTAFLEFHLGTLFASQKKINLCPFFVQQRLYSGECDFYRQKKG